jgi:hypothetical protein
VAVRDEVQAAKSPIESLLVRTAGPLTEQQRQVLQTAYAALQRLAQVTEKTIPPLMSTSKKQ